MAMNWAAIRATRFNKERPAEWPEGVRCISLEGLSLLGIHEETGNLYWDGKEIVIKRRLRLETLERWIALLVACGTFGSFIVDAGRALGKWS
jgi:hypothetical protein